MPQGSLSPASDFNSVIRQGFGERGIDVDVKQVQGGEIAKLAKAFLADHEATQRDGQSALVVGGGDGTLGSVASILAGTDVALGILPLGTLNHFAKDLGVPLKLEAAMDVIAAGQSQRIDVAEVNGRIFVNNSSVGVYPFLVEERTAEQRLHGVGKLAALLPALFKTLRASSWQRVIISAEGAA